MYLLDSCTISDFMRGDCATLNKIKILSPTLIYTSTITQMEITYGLLRRFEKTHPYFTVFKEFLSNITILPFDQKAAVECSIMRKVLESKGTPIGAYDILIAGIAKAEDLILVTSNINEFIRIDNLKIENWRI